MTNADKNTFRILYESLDRLRQISETMSRSMASNHITPLPSFYDAHNSACFALGVGFDMYEKIVSEGIGKGIDV